MENERGLFALTHRLNTESGRHSARNGIWWQLKGYLYCMFDIYNKVEYSL